LIDVRLSRVLDELLKDPACGLVIDDTVDIGEEEREKGGLRFGGREFAELLDHIIRGRIEDELVEAGQKAVEDLLAFAGRAILDALLEKAAACAIASEIHVLERDGALGSGVDAGEQNVAELADVIG
jgi:hypothetical protein